MNGSELERRMCFKNLKPNCFMAFSFLVNEMEWEEKHL